MAWLSARRHRAAHAGRVAVLFDADNVPPSRAGAVLTAVAAEHGPVRFARAYGDWSRPHLSSWRPAVLAHAIRRVDAIAASSGKDCSDHVMVADAVHLALCEELDAIALVSSDGDFTELALRLREYGLQVHGFGQRTTPVAFTRACQQFTYLDDLIAADRHRSSSSTTATNFTSHPATSKATPAARPAAFVGKTAVPAKAADRLRRLVITSADPEGWANLSTVCLRLHKQTRLKTELAEQLNGKPGRYLKECGLFEVTDRIVNGSSVTFIRDKSQP